MSVHLFSCFLTNANAHPDGQEEEGGQGLPRQDQHHGRRARVQLGLQGDQADDHFLFVDD